MSYNYTIEYRKFDDLVNEVKMDFKKYNLEGLIEPQDLIKVATRVNYHLGLRVNKTKEKIIQIIDGKFQLPCDFQYINYSLYCDSGAFNEPQKSPYFPSGTNVDENGINTSKYSTYHNSHPSDEPCSSKCYESSSCSKCPQCNIEVVDYCHSCVSDSTSCSVDKNGSSMVINNVGLRGTMVYRNLMPIRLKDNPQAIDCDCPNLYWETELGGYIQDGWFYVNVNSGNVYLNYQSLMEDDDGNLLVVDHPMINEYYEYALKSRLLENLIMDDQKVNPNKIQLIESRLRFARNQAISICRTPNFKELQKTWKMNRKAMYGKYYNTFSTRNPNFVSNKL